MKTVIIVHPTPGQDGAGATRAIPTADAFEKCFNRLGWKIERTSEKIREPADIIAGYGWRPVMREAWEQWPERILHTDGAFWSRTTYLKLSYGGRWSPLADHRYGPERLHMHRIVPRPSRLPGPRILLCGMSEKAAGTFGLRPQEWEEQAASRLRAAGAKVIYRPKPTWQDAKPISKTIYDRDGRSIEESLNKVDAVVSHHSNAAIDALVAGLPIYVEIGIAKTLSVTTIEDSVGAMAPSIDERSRFLRQIAWHQWTIAELAKGAWLEPPAPLSSNPILAGE